VPSGRPTPAGPYQPTRPNPLFSPAPRDVRRPAATSTVSAHLLTPGPLPCLSERRRTEPPPSFHPTRRIAATAGLVAAAVIVATPPVSPTLQPPPTLMRLSLTASFIPSAAGTLTSCRRSPDHRRSQESPSRHPPSQPSRRPAASVTPRPAHHARRLPLTSVVIVVKTGWGSGHRRAVGKRATAPPHTWPRCSEHAAPCLGVRCWPGHHGRYPVVGCAPVARPWAQFGP
jgi:hypothetical protein